MIIAVMESFLIVLASFIVLSSSESFRLSEMRMQRVREFNKTITGMCTKEVFLEEADPESTGITGQIEECCVGFKPYDYDPGKCIPDCPNGCENGFCIEPNVCHCFPDHVRSYDGQCVPTCPISCINGECHSDGTCTCKANFVLEPKKQFCTPICRQNCDPLKYCSAPETCTCLPGYEEDSMRRCKPICPMNCLNGECVEPGICVCKSGFKLKDKVCQANCTSCAHGQCVANNICSCNPGYTFDLTRNRCVSVCSECSNGICRAPGVCECLPGYKMEDGLCKPDCGGECKNGHCVAPNICNCKDGFARNLFGQCKRLNCFHRDDEKTDCVIKHLG